MNIYICVGSSCHVKGSYDVKEKLQELIRQYHVQDQIELKGTFCLGMCKANGVTIKFDQEIVSGITLENLPDIFKKHCLDQLTKG